LLFLFDQKVEELLLVVGNFEHYTRTRDVSFITPSERPCAVSNAMSEDERKKPRAFNKTWSMTEEDVAGYMQDYKADQPAERKRLVEG
jgi:hypothetical protein